MTKKIKLKISQRLTKKKTRRNGHGPRQCRFCGSDEQALLVDYKNSSFMRSFLTERGKILPARISGSCARHQRKIGTEVKKARTMALLPFTAQYF